MKIFYGYCRKESGHRYLTFEFDFIKILRIIMLSLSFVIRTAGKVTYLKNGGKEVLTIQMATMDPCAATDSSQPVCPQIEKSEAYN